MNTTTIITTAIVAATAATATALPVPTILPAHAKAGTTGWPHPAILSDPPRPPAVSARGRPLSHPSVIVATVLSVVSNGLHRRHVA